MALFAANKDRLGVQIPVDGDRQVNDAIRGKGVYDNAVKALFVLKDANIRHWISCIVSKTNIHCCRDILDLASTTHSINNNVTPYAGVRELMLTYQEWKAFKYNWKQYAAKINLYHSHGNHGCGFIYRCDSRTAGVTVNPDGTLTGCARNNRVLCDYKNISKIISPTIQLMNQTCMKKRWGTIDNFALKMTLE